MGATEERPETALYVVHPGVWLVAGLESMEMVPPARQHLPLCHSPMVEPEEVAAVQVLEVLAAAEAGIIRV
jgi:hypothetical protein